MTETIIVDNQNSVIINSNTTPEVVLVNEQSTVVVGVPDQQTTVVSGILGPTGPAGRNAPTVHTYQFEISLQWSVVHNKNTRNFIPVLFDVNGTQFFAKVDTVDSNTFIVKLTEAVAGSVSVIFREL